jgi:hypothetical protein
MTDKAPEQKALDVLQAEAKGRRLEDGSTIVPLITDGGSHEITVPPPSLWYEGAVEALRDGQVSAWAKLALERDSLDLWNSLRKRYRDLDAFIGAWTRATGEDPGESQGSSAS